MENPPGLLLHAGIPLQGTEGAEGAGVAVRILYYDCFAGISGDMHLAALLDLGMPVEHLQAELDKLGLEGWSLRLTPDSKNGIGGTRLDVDLGPPRTARFRAAAASSLTSETPHEHRRYRDIRALIEGSPLDSRVKTRSLAIFDRIARAEAKVHGVPVEDVGFHEVGAVDSIIDIVGAAIGIEYFRPDRILASPPELGGGMVKCAHGLIPVPAPATVEILHGMPVKTGAVPFEMTTPTGAAILAANADRFSGSERLTIRKTGYGIGHRTVAIPNLLRVHLAELADEAEAWGELSTATVLECNLDDMTGEALGALYDTLFQAGASDVWQTPIQMKKGRPALTLSVLSDGGHVETLTELLFRHTSTFGLRGSPVDKRALRRTFRSFASSLGAVTVKEGWVGDRVVKAKPEYEDCRALAEALGRPVREVISIIQGELDAARPHC